MGRRKKEYPELINKFANIMQVLEDKSPATVKWYKSVAYRFYVWLRERGVKLSQIDRDIVIEFLSEIDSESTRTATKIVIKRFLEFAVQERIINIDIYNNIFSKKFKFGRVEQRLDYFTKEDVKYLIEITPYVFKDKWVVKLLQAFMQLLYETGLRKSHALQLRVGDVDLENKRIRLARIRDNPRKKKPEIDCFISDSLAERLEEITIGRVEYEPLFPLKESTLYKYLREVGCHALMKVYPHKFRHTFATYFYRETLDIDGLKRLGGWKSDTAIGRYIHRKEEELSKAHHRVFQE